MYIISRFTHFDRISRLQEVKASVGFTPIISNCQISLPIDQSQDQPMNSKLMKIDAGKGAYAQTNDVEFKGNVDPLNKKSF